MTSFLSDTVSFNVGSALLGAVVTLVVMPMTLWSWQKLDQYLMYRRAWKTTQNFYTRGVNLVLENPQWIDALLGTSRGSTTDRRMSDLFRPAMAVPTPAPAPLQKSDSVTVEPSTDDFSGVAESVLRDAFDAWPPLVQPKSTRPRR